MKNPLRKRVLRELKKDAVKYAAIFIMMVLLISMCSGMRVSNESLKKAYYDSFEKYNTEDGHITFDKALPEDLRNTLEEKGDVRFFENMYIDTDIEGTDKTVRTYKISDEINDSCLLSGEYPSADDEIVLDRLFARNNEINIGDQISLKGNKYTVTGVIALAQYSTLYENNTDSMFDSINFSIAEMTDEGFGRLDERNLRYCYAWQYNSKYADDVEQAELSEKFIEVLKDEVEDYDEAIAEEQIDKLTDRLEKAGEEYGNIYKDSVEEKLIEVSEKIKNGAAEYAAVFSKTGKAPSASDLSVDDFQFSVIEETVKAMMTGSEAVMPSEEEFVKQYIDSVQKPTKDQLSYELDDFLFGIICDAAEAEINDEEYEMPEDEEFEDEIDKTDIIGVDNYIPRYLNNAIIFAIDDIGGDETGTMVMCYMMIAVIAFVFAVTISGTIVSEAGVIGTLRASGYTKAEIIRHYMTLPIIVTFISGVAGNIIGYTALKDFCANLYLGSYSLPSYTTVWDSSAFILSTVIPILLMLFINFITLYTKLKLSPLKFLRRDLKKNGNKKAMRLNTKIPYRTRFSLRIFFTNLPGYIVMIIGIMFGAVLIAFGDMLPRLFDDMKEIITEDMICDYQYIVYDCEEADDPGYENAEKFAMSSFDFTKKGFVTDEITVYGISENSRYVTYDIPEGKAVISKSISEKYGLDAGDTIVLDKKFKKDCSYTLEISGVCDYMASLSIFTGLDDYNRTFGEKESYFTGYFSDRELTEMDPDDVAAVMTLSDYTKISDQLAVSMGGLMGLFKYFGAMFFIIVVYVLCKQIIERNFHSISLTKILGFKNSEIGSLYILSTTLAVLIGLGLSVPIIDISVKAIFKGYLYTMMAGYLPCIISPVTYAIMIGIGLACYAVVAALQMLKVSRVSKSEALKNVE